MHRNPLFASDRLIDSASNKVRLYLMWHFVETHLFDFFGIPAQADGLGESVRAQSFYAARISYRTTRAKAYNEIRSWHSRASDG